MTAPSPVRHLIETIDWRRTPLGSRECWQGSLATIAEVVLNSPFPMFLVWGEERTLIYNDAYVQILGDLHPGAMGRPFFETWPDVRETVEPIIGAALKGRGSYFENLPVELRRFGRLEQAWFTFSYSPVVDESGSIPGALCVCMETTASILLNERRTFLAQLRDRLRAMTDGAAIVKEAQRAIGTHLKASRVGYGSLDEGERFFTTLDNWTDGSVPHHSGTHDLAVFGEGVLGAIRRGQTLVVHDLESSEFTPKEQLEPFRALEIEAAVTVSLVKGGRAVAVMYVHQREPRAWTASEVATIEEVAEITWSALEQSLAEAALRESEARFRLMADAVPQIVWITDSEGRAEFFNKQWSNYTGVPYAPTMAADVAANHVHPDDAATTMEAFDQARRSGAAFHVEHRIRSASGEYRWFLVRAEPHRDAASGQVVRWFGASVDIHDRKLAEKQLRELNINLEQRVAEALAERKLLADLVESTDAFVQVADPDFRWLAINKAAADEFERIFGVRPKVGDSMLELLADKPEHQAAVRAVWGRALAGEEFTEVGQFGDPGRERRYYEMKYHVLHGTGGERIGAYQFAYDVTDRVREQRRLAEAEAARREADALYRAYFENSPEALFVIGVTSTGDFVVEQVNPAREAGVGFKLEEVRGKRVDDILPPDIAKRVIKAYRQVVETSSMLQYREIFDLGGHPRHWDTSLVPVRAAHGRVVRLIGSSRDVTRQVIAEEALRQSQKMEAMGQLTGGVAHDFNNLLTPIVGSLDMLQRKALGGEREQRLVAGAMQSAERAKTLVQRLLAFARRQPLQAVPVDVAKIVLGMGDLVASTTGPQIKVVVEAAESVPPAMADSNQLEMALLNLAVNARDAMAEGGTLRISASAEHVGPDHPSGVRAGRYIRLSVADTGSGMDEATLARAVEPFFSTKGVGKGTGLGLSMVHGLASQLGGALTIRSRPGLGTNVELWLPESATEPERETPSGARPTFLERGTALLVDDEELVRLSTADMLTDLGYRVREAASAEEAIRLLDAGQQFDLLVTDHLMPGMNGTELARAARAARPGLPVLLVSGYAETEGIAAEIPRLTKPFRKDELASSLAQLAPDDARCSRW